MSKFVQSGGGVRTSFCGKNKIKAMFFVIGLMGFGQYAKAGWGAMREAQDREYAMALQRKEEAKRAQEYARQKIHEEQQAKIQVFEKQKALQEEADRNGYTFKDQELIDYWSSQPKMQEEAIKIAESNKAKREEEARRRREEQERQGPEKKALIKGLQDDLKKENEIYENLLKRAGKDGSSELYRQYLKRNEIQRLLDQEKEQLDREAMAKDRQKPAAKAADVPAIARFEEMQRAADARHRAEITAQGPIKNSPYDYAESVEDTVAAATPRTSASPRPASPRSSTSTSTQRPRSASSRPVSPRSLARK